MNHLEIIEGFEEAIAVLIEKVVLCEFYAGIYSEAPLSPADSQQLQNMLNSALPEFYAAIIVFAIKAHSYFEAAGTYVKYGI